MLETVLGVAAAIWGVVMAVSPALQIRKMLQHRSSREVSVAYFCVLLVGFVLWIAYGISIENWYLSFPTRSRSLCARRRSRSRSASGQGRVIVSVDAVSGERLITGPFVRVWLGTFAGFASFGFLLLTLPLYVHDELDRGSVAIGIAVGSASITAVLLGPRAGRLADRRGRRPLILGGTAVMIGCYLLLALGPSLPLVVLIRLVAGAGEAAFAIAILTAAADLAPAERRGEAMSLVTTASYLGLTIGPVAADFILGDDRFALNWVVAASLVVLGTVAVIPLGETRPASAHEAPGQAGCRRERRSSPVCSC